MTEIISRFRALLVILPLALVSGCNSAPVLITKSAETPAGVDLSGSWRIRADPDALRSLRRAAARDDLIIIDRRQNERRRQRKSVSSAQVFLEFGELLKITQTDYGLFLSYDRSVVEEYTFGENRVVTIGPIEAARVSGWIDQAFTVETLDDSRSMLVETWQLESDGDVLVRDIRVSKGDKVVFTQQQVFDRL